MYDEDLNTLDDGLRRLKVEYDSFFNGGRKRAPEDSRLRVEKLVKRLSEASDMSLQDRFRYTTLVSRFYVYRDRWRRTTAAREEARREAPLNAPAPGKPRADQPTDGVCISITDPDREEAKVRQLYDALVRAKGKEQSSSISYPQFSKYITTQTRSIRGKSGCPSVLFTVTLEENAIKFTARAEDPPKSL